MLINVAKTLHLWNRETQPWCLIYEKVEQSGSHYTTKNDFRSSLHKIKSSPGLHMQKKN